MSVFGTSKERVQVAYIPIFKCDGCGIQSEGQTAHVEMDQVSEYSFENKVALTSNHHMPVGWSGFDRRHLCPSCK